MFNLLVVPYILNRINLSISGGFLTGFCDVFLESILSEYHIFFNFKKIRT